MTKTMEENTQVADETLAVQEEGENSENSPEAVETVDKSEYDKLAEIATNQKVRAEKAEKERKALEVELNKKTQATSVEGAPLDVSDYIDISASLEGLDQREKEYLAQQHKLTGKPLNEIRKEEDFGLWQSAYQAKKAKDLTLTPTGTQSDSDAPKSVTERLRNATLAEKEQILADAGLWKSPRPKSDRTNIGTGR